MGLTSLLLILKGSSSSGNWGHGGRPGKHGGSAPGGGYSSSGEKKPRVGAQGGKKVEEKSKPPELKKEERFEDGKEDSLLELYKNYGYECLNLNDPGCVALNNYTGYDYEGINYNLRNKRSLSVDDKKTIEGIDKAMNEAPRTTENMTVYRRITPALVESLIQEGVQFQDRAFVSTTIDKNTQFWNLEIRIPKGSKGIYVAGLSSFAGEKEFLLPRNAKFNVVKKSDSKAILEFIGDD